MVDFNMALILLFPFTIFVQNKKNDVVCGAAIREECAQSSKCSKYKRHFDHCQERVLGGKGDHGEDCVEELFHLMHCVDECATPKIASKLV